MFPAYDENKQYLQNEFTDCQWDVSTGLDPAVLERQINELWDTRDDEAVSVVKAHIQHYIVEHAQLEVNSHSLFAGKMNQGITYTRSGRSKQGMYERLFFRVREETLRSLIPQTFDLVKNMERIGVGSSESDFWHTLPDWGEILRLGLPGLRDRIIRAREEKQQAGALTGPQDAFYESVLISLDTVNVYITRLIDYAEGMEGMTPYVECLRHIRERKPETIYHAMMLSLIYVYIEEMGCERARSLGRIDQLYLPFFRHDLEKGIYTKDEISELFRYLFGRYSQAGRFAAQPFTLGGTLADGTDAWNELSDLILDVYDGMDILDPKIHIRWYDGFPPERLRRIMRMIRSGHSAMVLVNDETVYRAYERLGISRQESRGYLPIGCYEPMIMGVEDAMIGASWMSIPKAVEFVFSNGRDVAGDLPFGPQTGTEFDSFDEFYRAFLIQLDNMVEQIIDGIEKQNAIAMRVNPSPLYSCSMASCVERGKDVFEGGMQRSNVSVKCCGIGTTADALAAVKLLVFDQKLISYAELRKAVLGNWRGFGWLRERALALPEKFGNHKPLTDQLAHDVYDHLFKLYVGRKAGRGGVYRMGGDSITRCISLGERLWATPDGRLSGESTSKNFSGTAGREKEGLTALLLSALAIDQTQFADAGVLDFVAHPSAVEGDAGLDALVTVAQVYLKKGGFALQGNVLKPEQLREAQRHPEKYPNLQVRVCGWNEYFVQMSEESQNAFIARLEAI